MFTFPSGLLNSQNVDPYLANVVLHLKGDGANIVDSSPANRTITLTGSPYIDTTKSKYGGSSINISTGNNLNVSAPNTFLNDFTIEAWVNQSTLSANNCIMGSFSGGNWFFNLSSANGGSLNFYLTTTHYTFTITRDLNTWVHYAVCRSGTTLSGFKNGFLLGQKTVPSTALSNTSNAFKVGDRLTSSIPFIGNLDSVRITNIARYTANFNPETDTYLAY